MLISCEAGGPEGGANCDKISCWEGDRGVSNWPRSKVLESSEVGGSIQKVEPFAIGEDRVEQCCEP